MKQRIRVVSNGFGEDCIGATLVSAVDLERYDVIVCPLVGKGSPYKLEGFLPILEQELLPSGGFLRHPMDVVRDFSTGLLKTTVQQHHCLKQHPAELQWVVGDVFALLMATFQQDIPTVFFPTAKSERVIPHSRIEFMLIKKRAKLVFPRDIETHQAMLDRGIESKFIGNPMFDGIQSELGSCESNVVGILPGSRDEVVGNIHQVLCVIEQLELSNERCFMMAVSPNVTHKKLQHIHKRIRYHNRYRPT